MLAIPQVELRGGACLRPSSESDGVMPVGDALEVARSWAAVGFSRIHLIDRGTIADHHSNGTLVDEIVRDGAIEVQIDDAADSSDEIDRLVSAGAVRVVLGPRGLDEPEWLASTAESYPGLLM